jgi:hypothetical protein
MHMSQWVIGTDLGQSHLDIYLPFEGNFWVKNEVLVPFWGVFQPLSPIQTLKIPFMRLPWAPITLHFCYAGRRI